MSATLVNEIGATLRRRSFSVRMALFLTLCCWMAGTGAVRAFDTVILDPGHGGHDRGAAIGYVFEKHLALDTARRVEQLLRAQGLKVIMTRSSDVFIPLPGRSSKGNSVRNAVFVSIHYNYSRGGSGNGLETFYCHNDSYKLAGYIQAYIIQESRLSNRGVKHANYHVIRETSKNPAVLVECGFVSNSSERAAMMTGLYRERLAVGIAKGILAYRMDK
ncbi:N-acetylmuramoyl-L-alanine amidase [Roseimicrobium gellanilyticum]|uniref:N-acetylmuramoyl-L-alanine amidase n=1 Tax=Roseimicrobium gellanilyticum TaxID=748857 RepID=A0A366HPI0_9BACT|nr:N-acetylmuramoyl-L-alanine amidase [Roseimicrobium gellanilyticum]RBP45406.1 N-acetylmuramoyl-L-alanine amidase [Roseimicrobium gellanilyticum]